MDEEFPGVVELNVCGIHCRALLSTLTRDEDSKLAAMFTGRHPVFKDKDGRYFIEADGLLFNAILHYLRYDKLPFQEASYPGARFRFGGARVFRDHQNEYSAQNIEMLYKDALNLGLAKLAKHLELFQPNFVNIKMDEYRQSVRGYESCLTEILNVVPAESLFHKTEFTLRIKQDLQTIAEEKCCEHECKMTPFSTFGQPFYTSIDALVKVTFEINPTVLSALAIDLQKRGYSVQGRMTVCDFGCKKEVKKSKYIVFTGQTKKCCTEELFLLTFKWDIDADGVAHRIIGPKQPFEPTRRGLFGEPANSGFSFGTSTQKPSGFGLFGGGVQQGSFGQEDGGGFGATPHQGTFGSGSSFGSTQQGNFGQGQSFSSNTPQQQGMFGQGSSAGFSNVQQGAFGQTHTTGSSSPKEEGTFRQGTGFNFGGTGTSHGMFGQSQTSPFSFSQQQGTFGQGSGFNFGGTGTSHGMFGQSQTSPFSFTQQQGTFGQGSPFGFGAGVQQYSAQGKQVQQQKGPSFNTSVTQAQGKNLFGSTSQTSNQRGAGLFGSSMVSQQQTSPGTSTNKPVFGESPSFFSENEKIFGSPKKSPGSSGFSFGSPQETQTAFSGKGAKTGPQQSGQSSSFSPQSSSQPVFGGSPTFENKFGGLSLRQNEPVQSSGSTTTAFDSSSNTLFGKNAETDEQKFEFVQEQ